MMKQVPRGTIDRGRLAGSSGNPQPHELGNGVTVFLPCWKAMLPDGTEFEGQGIQPDIPVSATARDFERGDAVLEAALTELRAAPRDVSPCVAMASSRSRPGQDTPATLSDPEYKTSKAWRLRLPSFRAVTRHEPVVGIASSVRRAKSIHFGGLSQPRMYGAHPRVLSSRDCRFFTCRTIS